MYRKQNATKFDHFIAPRPAIMGPATMTFPHNDGWYLLHQSPHAKNDGKPRKHSRISR
jgi:hypothetical protein